MKLFKVFFISCMLLFSQNAMAAYPEQSINVIIPFSAGGPADIQARIMQKHWNKYVPEKGWVFVYKTGAGGAIGFTETSRAKPNGYSIGALSTPHIILQPPIQKAPYTVNDFTYLAQVANDPQVVTVRKDSPYETVDELFNFVKANPGKVKLGLVGPASGQHLMALDFEQKFPDIKFTFVFYKGSSDQNTALIGGEIDVMFGNVSDVMRALAEFKPLAVASVERHSFLPETVTLQEAGYDVVSEIRRLLAAPKNLNPEALAFLNETIKKIANDPDYIADMIKAGVPPAYLDSEETTKFVMETNAELVKMIEETGLGKR